MSRSFWRTCSRSRANTKSSTPGFLPTCFEAVCSFSGFLRTAGNVLLRPAKLFDRFPRAAPQEGISSLSFGEVAIGLIGKEAFSIAKAAGEDDFADSIRARIALYEKASPFRGDK